jgi:hypothetical protein
VFNPARFLYSKSFGQFMSALTGFGFNRGNSIPEVMIRWHPEILTIICDLGEHIPMSFWKLYQPAILQQKFQNSSPDSETIGLLLPALAVHHVRLDAIDVRPLDSGDYEKLSDLIHKLPEMPHGNLSIALRRFIGTAIFLVRSSPIHRPQIHGLTPISTPFFVAIADAFIPRGSTLDFCFTTRPLADLLGSFFQHWHSEPINILGLRAFCRIVPRARESSLSFAPFIMFLEVSGVLGCQDSSIASFLAEAVGALSHLPHPERLSDFFTSQNQAIWSLYLRYPPDRHTLGILGLPQDQILRDLGDPETSVAAFRVLAAASPLVTFSDVDIPSFPINEIMKFEPSSFDQIAAFFVGNRWITPLLAMLEIPLEVGRHWQIIDHLKRLPLPELRQVMDIDTVLLPLILELASSDLAAESEPQATRLLFALVREDPVLINLITHHIGRFRNVMVMLDKSLVDECHREFSADPEAFEVAVTKSFVRVGNTIGGRADLLFATPYPVELEPVSEYVERLIGALLLAASNAHRNWLLYLLLMELAGLNPAHFRDFDLIPLFEAIFELGPSLPQYSAFPNQFLDDVFAALAGFSLIMTLLSCPRIADSFFNWAFRNFDNFDVGQAALFMDTFYAFLESSEYSLCLYAYFNKYHWPGIYLQKLAGFTIDRFGQAVFYRDVELIQSYLSTLNNLADFLVVAIDELSKQECPFQCLCNTATTIFPPLDLHMGRTLRDIGLPTSNPIFVTLNHRVPDGNLFLTYHPWSANLMPARGTSLYRPPVLPLSDFPPQFSREAILALPPKLAAAVLLKSLPTFPEQLNQAMTRFLVVQPNWIYAFLCNPDRTKLLLPVHHLLQLHELLPQLHALADVADENVEGIRCELGLSFEDLDCLFDPIDWIQDRNPILLLVEPLVARNELITRYLVSKVVSRMSVEDTQSNVLLPQILCEMTGAPHFHQIFLELAAERSIEILALPPSRRCLYFSTICELIANLGDAVPDSGVQLVNLLLTTASADHNVHAALTIAAKLPEAKREPLYPLVEKVFPDLLGSNDESWKLLALNASVIFQAFPFLRLTFRGQLLDLLWIHFGSFGMDKLRFLGPLLNELAPSRDDSFSSRLLEPSEDTGLISVPARIKAITPDFWSIVTHFRELISSIIKENVAVLGQEFRFLLTFPEILELDDKIRYFQATQKVKVIHSKSVVIRVRRDQVLADTFTVLQSIRPEEFLQKFRIIFMGEPGFDQGGLTREWFSIVVKDLFNPNSALFIPSSNHRTFQPNPGSGANPSHISYFRLAGLIIGRALVAAIPIEAHFSSGFLKQILRGPIDYRGSLRDLEQADARLYSSLQWILDHHLGEHELNDLNFSVDVDQGGVRTTMNLIANGSEISVTEENKGQYVSLVVQHHLTAQIAEQVQAFCDGFYAMVPQNEISFFTPSELDLLICGLPEIDVQDFMDNCDFSPPYHPKHPVIELFFHVIKEWDTAHLARLLIFLTGSSQVPFGGFRVLRETDEGISIACGGHPGRLPEAHTCTNTLDLPEYRTAAEMKEKLEFAMAECNDFGFI